MRLLAGLMAAQQFDTELSGDESLSKRPMERELLPCVKWVLALRLEKEGAANQNKGRRQVDRLPL